MEVKCSVNFIDFEGRSDGESIKKLITQVKPRQLVSTIMDPLRIQDGIGHLLGGHCNCQLVLSCGTSLLFNSGRQTFFKGRSQDSSFKEFYLKVLIILSFTVRFTVNASILYKNHEIFKNQPVKDLAYFIV